MAFRSRTAQRGKAGRGDAAQRLAESARFYADADARGALFRAPERPELLERRRRTLEGGAALDVEWASTYEPIHPTYAARLAERSANRTAHARWLRHAEVRPVLVCLHGWGGGLPAIEERAFVARWWYRKGMDVVLPALPFHGARAGSVLRRPSFPSTDPIVSNEGFAQAVHDLRALAAALRARGAPAVVLTGMSLGGFTTTLAATVDTTFDAAIPMIPFASLPRLLWDHGSGTPARERAKAQGIDLPTFEAAFAATSPLRRTPRLDPTRVLVLAADGDAVTPPHHAAEIRDHFSNDVARAQLVAFAGAHLLQVGRGDAFRAMARFLGGHGWLPSRKTAKGA
ncbi:MAG: prolyl oligopeptidase family serine peptidase [Deltaproteobacteria bacterium]|nr:prolyl oligopeptidase family serine peptidase [Deltaproteobacteria bacterium]